MIQVTVSKKDGVTVSIDGNIKELINDTLAMINGVYATLDDSTRGLFKDLVAVCVSAKDGPVWVVPEKVERAQEGEA